ncbi:MAG: hypothetical protein FWG73_05565 [Planctomycetaceae bacterium]|nr:hypothetical protein [Planctomycetaceae bacterium]
MSLRKIFLKLLKQHKTERLAPSLLDWAAHFLPKHFNKPPSTMHRWLAEQLDQLHHQRGTKLNILAPRNSAKSTIAALAYPLHEILTQREPYIWIISDTMSQAHTHLDNIKTELMTNPLLADAYPDACGKGNLWHAGAIRLRNGGVIEAYGTGQQIRGRRRAENKPTLMICDDLQSDRHALSEPARQKSRNWFHDAILKAGSQNTNVIHLATALHREAIAMELLQTPGWRSKTFRAIEQFPKNMPLWTEWEMLYINRDDADAFYEKNRTAMDEDAVVLWPEQESLYDLMKMRVESGYSSFEREKQNSPINPELCEFPEKYFEEHIWYVPNDAANGNIVASALALDPSKGKDAALGDYSAFIYVALCEDGIFYVDAHLERLPISELVAKGVELYAKYRPTIFGVEANQFQELLCDEFEKQLLGTVCYPIRNTLGKQTRIRRLDSYLAMQRLRFCADSASCRLVVEQLRSFPLASHDDGPDALEMALRLLEATQ